MNDKIRILSVEFPIMSKAEARERAALFLDAPTGAKIFTPNPQMLLAAKKDPSFSAILNSAELLLPDGVGIKIASHLQKKPIPERVRRIGVVSSPTGAVIRDIIDVTHRRNNTIDIVLFPVKVQGVGADKEIAMGIDFFSQYDNVDVVIVARGGGSMEDLEPFNSEVVATATYNCNKPIVSAVGHETDFTIIDFVSDLRAPTPSVAAELVAWDKSLLIESIYSSIRIMEKNILSKVNNYGRDVMYLYDKLNNNISNKIVKFDNQIDKQLLNLNTIDKINPTLCYSILFKKV